MATEEGDQVITFATVGNLNLLTAVEGEVFLFNNYQTRLPLF